MLLDGLFLLGCVCKNFMFCLLQLELFLLIVAFVLLYDGLFERFIYGLYVVYGT